MYGGTMALSDYERKMLEQLEAQLADDDPKLAESLAAKESSAMQTAISPKHLVVGLIVAVVGLLVVLGAVAIDQIVLGIAGFLVVFGGFWYLAAGMERVKAPAGSGQAQRKSRTSFMEQQMDEWRKRQQG